MGRSPTTSLCDDSASLQLFGPTTTGLFPEPFDDNYSSQDSSTSSACLALDPLHIPDRSGVETSFVHRMVSSHEEACEIRLQPGDVIIDTKGKEWICRSCFCGDMDCSGKAVRPLEGKEDMDAWDRGRSVLCKRV